MKNYFQMDSELKLVRSIEWNEVFSIWEKQEADLQYWIEHYKHRGFNSWQDWRRSSVEELNPENLKWNLYEVLDPMVAVPKFHAGPFRAWIKKYYKDKETITFSELTMNIEIQNDNNIHEIIKNFPKNSIIVGVVNDGKIVIVDGLHRCCALSIEKEDNGVISTQLFIALADFSGKLPLLGQENSPT